jgi:uncharacterized DUF497 family protein
VEFEWDPIKSKLNLQKHGISFDEAKEIFLGKVLTAEDNRKEYGEKRLISIGSILDIIVLVVVHTDRKKRTRIISARKANKKEKEMYYEYLKKKT